MLSGHVFRQQMWAPAIGVIGGGVLPTPTTITSRQNSHSTDSSGRPLLQMAVEISLLPTPTTNDSKNASLPPSQAERDGLAGAMLRNDSIPTGAATYLNPSFVEEMMGFPVGWTD
jgi:hypothetical protein